MKKRGLAFVLLLMIAMKGSAQFSRYVIQFKNKGTSPYSISNPSVYLSPAALARRTRYNISIDSLDLPVTPRYVDSVRLAGAVTILNVSKWLNSVSIQTNDATALTKINALPFVQTVAPIAARPVSGGRPSKLEQTNETILSKTEGISDYFNYGSAYAQIHIHNGEFLHNIGLRGQGRNITFLDGGFNNYLTVKAFDSVRANNQILGIFDFVAHDNSVNEDDAHGMQCFSTVGANIPGQFVGTAPKATFYLFRTEEVATEYPIEEHNWVCGAERADSLGSDVISSSLGYNTFDNSVFDHTYADMNGRTTMAAKGAAIAARKGLLVVVAAGNEGGNSWGKITTPGDADSIITVGAVTASGIAAGFTSRGPSSDGRVKPDVASVGVNTTVQLPGNTIGTGNGTSFACPNMAGLATCLWQGFPEYNNQVIIKTLQQSANRFTTPNDTTGYGIPDIKKATLILLKRFSTATGTTTNCKTTLSWTSKDVSSMRYEVERKVNGQSSYIQIATQAANGTVFSAKNYTYNDTLINVPAGSASYRIRQVIDTATASLSADYIDTVTVTVGSGCIATGVGAVNTTAFSMRLIPNPAYDKTVLQVFTPSPLSQAWLQLADESGRQVLLIRQSMGAGSNNIPVSLSGLAKGKYYVSLYDGNRMLGTLELLRL